MHHAFQKLVDFFDRKYRNSKRDVSKKHKLSTKPHRLLKEPSRLRVLLAKAKSRRESLRSKKQDEQDSIRVSSGNKVTGRWGFSIEQPNDSTVSSEEYSAEPSDDSDDTFDAMEIDSGPNITTSPATAATELQSEVRDHSDDGPKGESTNTTSPAAAMPELLPDYPDNSSDWESINTATMDQHCAFEAQYQFSETDRDWAVMKIPHFEFKKILSQNLQGPADFDEDDFEFVSASRGGSNYVRVYKLTKGANVGTYAVRVPSVGTADQWQNPDAYMLRCEFGTMRLIHKRTKCPIPEVLAYDDSLENDLGAPYMIMRGITGVNAARVWFDPTEENGTGDVSGHSPSASRMEVRRTFLRSLAYAMAELRTLEFNSLGMLNFDDVYDATGGPKIGSSWYRFLDKHTGVDMWAEHHACSSSTKWFSGALWPVDPTMDPLVKGIHSVMRALLASEPFTFSGKHGEVNETFVLRHEDLDWQNIFCDPTTGEVTAIIDWQGCRAVPRCIGYASLPAFLMGEWRRHYSFCGELHMPWQLESYRKTYADAMLEATESEGDGRYTAKSAIYQAAYAALYGGSLDVSFADFVANLLRLIPRLYCMDIDDLKKRLVDDSPETEMFIKEEMKRVLA